MLPINKKLKLIALGFTTTILLALLLSMLFGHVPKIGNLIKNLDLYFYSIFFRPSLQPDPSFIIIDANDETGYFNRSDYAKMIRSLHRAKVKCIALDIWFISESQYDSRGDQDLANAVEQCPWVILSIDFSYDAEPSARMTTLLEQFALPDSLCKNITPIFVADNGVSLPYNGIMAAAKHIGHINTTNEEYYHFPPIIEFERKFYPSLPIAVAKYCAKIDKQNFSLENIPFDDDGQMLINFISMQDFAPFPYSWSEANEMLAHLDEDTSIANKFQNSIVLIINSPLESQIHTIVGPYPRWGLIASVTNQLIQDRHIDTSVGIYLATISALLISLSLIWFLFVTSRLDKRWRKTRLIFIPCNIIYLIIIFLLLRYGQLWLGVCLPLLIFNTSLFIVRAKYYAMIRPPRFVNFLVQVLEAQGEIYPIKVQSEMGEEEENAFFESFLKDETFQEILQKIKSLSATRAEMRWMGNKLFNAIFQGDIFHLLKNSVEKVHAEHQYLRLRLSIDSPELIRLPWELMHTSKIPPGFLVFNKRISVTRYLSLLQQVKTAEFHIPLKILVMVSNPSDLPPLKIKDEIKVLKKSLRKFRLGGDVRLRICRKATLENIRKELNRKPDVIHFIGHSYFDAEKKESYLCFETELSHTELIDEEMFGNMLHDSSVKLVILNSCESAASSECDVFTGIAQNLVKIGVPAVLAMQIEMPDKSAIWFSSVFYENFLTNYSIEFAVAEARRFIMDKIKLDRPDWAIPVLFMRSCEKFLC